MSTIQMIWQLKRVRFGTSPANIVSTMNLCVLDRLISINPIAFQRIEGWWPQLKQDYGLESSGYNLIVEISYWLYTRPCNIITTLTFRNLNNSLHLIDVPDPQELEQQSTFDRCNGTHRSVIIIHVHALKISELIIEMDIPTIGSAW